ncbi:Pkinase-domain-containing protein [Saitoella complicata NRRL Y-17804]|nr:Pkinase-domain-containing protein [Saitoella complicata NRRL Y-17804]ODQ54523.1 Pkinase-domain-containing protein [Saitoella complicata NRRL Y-17804]
MDDAPSVQSVGHHLHARGRVASLVSTSLEGDKVLPIVLNKTHFVGRKSSCDLVIPHRAVSSTHFKVYTVQFDAAHDPLIYIQDLSLNGTYHNGHKLGKDQCALLTDGDELEVRHAATFKFNQKMHYENKLGKIVEADARGFESEWKLTKRLLGTGGFAKIYMATSTTTHRQYACKVMDLTHARQKGIKYIQEIEILSSLCHPNVVGVHKCYITSSHIYIFEDLVSGGDLFSWFAERGVVGEVECMFVIWQVLKALEYLHERNIAHRDLKLENILISSSEPGFRVVLTDFGVARQWEDARRMSTIVGTPEYAAPEMSRREKGKRGYGKEIDLWSLGVIVHVLLSGHQPFSSTSQTDSRSQIAQRIQSTDLDLNSWEWEEISLEAKDFVHRLLVRNPAYRMSVEEAFEHPWLARYRAELEALYDEKVMKGWNASPSNKKWIETKMVGGDGDTEMSEADGFVSGGKMARKAAEDEEAERERRERKRRMSKVGEANASWGFVGANVEPKGLGHGPLRDVPGKRSNRISLSEDRQVGGGGYVKSGYFGK